MKRLLALACIPLLAAAGCDHEQPKPPAPKPAITIRGDGVRTVPYSASSLAEFVAAYPIGSVAEGDVVSVTPDVSDDQNTISTHVMVQVSRALGGPNGTIEVIESGGVVPLRLVRSQFEGKPGTAPLTESGLDQLVDFRMEGDPHSAVSDHVLMFLKPRNADGTWSLATKLVRSPDGQTYEWPENDAPNPTWAPRYTLREVADFLKR